MSSMNFFRKIWILVAALGTIVVGYWLLGMLLTIYLK